MGRKSAVSVARRASLQARPRLFGQFQAGVLGSSSSQGTALQVVSSFGYPMCSPSSGYPALSHSSRPAA
jgi:hypothetical protein